jgi:hypothetical protein
MNRRIAHLLGAAALAALTLQPVTTLADPPPHAQNDKRHDDRRCDDDRYRRDERWQDYDPRRHQVAPRLPSRARVVHYRGDRYYYGGGQWYRPYRSGYRVVAPPVYYVWHPKARGYVVTDRPVRRW